MNVAQSTSFAIDQNKGDNNDDSIRDGLPVAFDCYSIKAVEMHENSESSASIRSFMDQRGSVDLVVETQSKSGRSSRNSTSFTCV